MRNLESRADYVRERVARIRRHLAEAEGRMFAYDVDGGSAREAAMRALARYRKREFATRAARSRG